MVTDFALIVLRCADLSASKAFYEALGLTFRCEKHASGPEHWSCQIGSLVLELYPTSTLQTPAPERIGFHVANVETAVAAAVAAGGRLEKPGILLDPDGRKVELSVARIPESVHAHWSVWRQDDNGNRFLISSGHTRTQAERLCLEFEQRGHKQMYWISPDDS